jgi:hypothetical protein
MLHQTLHGAWAFNGWLYSRLIRPCDITGINDGGLQHSAMEEPTQQPSDNSIRQADSIETETELDAAILAALERAHEAHSAESFDNDSDDYIDAGSDCRHFDGTDCRLAQRIVSMLPTVVDILPVCPLRSNCRWWQQEGKAACLRCPQVVTKTYHPSEQLRQVATPTNKD